MTETTNLRPCPFCGHPAIMRIGNNGTYDTSDYYIECANEDCGVSTPMVVGHQETERMLTEIWNARVK